MPEAHSAGEAPSDWQLLSRTAAGDEEAFRSIVERHQDRLVRLCERLLQDREEALDAAQEVFLKTYRKAATLKPKGELFTWLFRVGTNHCLNRLRRRKIVRFLPLGDPSRQAQPPFEPPDGSPGPERQAESRRQWAETQQQIARLPPSQRAVLVLAKFEGLSYRQIARVLNITEGAVESRLFRAMRNLTRAQESSRKSVTKGEAR